MTTITPTAVVAITETAGNAITAATVTVPAANMADAYAKGSAALSRHADKAGSVAAVDRSEITGVEGETYSIRYF